MALLRKALEDLIKTHNGLNNALNGIDNALRGIDKACAGLIQEDHRGPS